MPRAKDTLPRDIFGLFLAMLDSGVPAEPKRRKRRPVYTEEEKAARKAERLEKEAQRQRKKEEKRNRLEWEEKLPSFRREDIPDNTKVMFYWDAKKQFALSDRELASLPVFRYNNSPKRIIALSNLLAHAKQRLEDIGVTCPALELQHESEIPYVMTKTSQYLDGLLGRREGFRRRWR